MENLRENNQMEIKSPHGQTKNTVECYPSKLEQV
jgi:hypothetical protein